MNDVIRIAERLLFDSLILGPTPISPYQKVLHGLVTFSWVLVFSGLMICLYSLFLWLLLYYPLHVAVVVIGAFVTCFGGIILALVHIFLLYQKTKFKRVSKKVAEKIKDTISEMDDEWGFIIRENPKIAIFVSALLGFVIEQNINKKGNKL